MEIYLKTPILKLENYSDCPAIITANKFYLFSPKLTAYYSVEDVFDFVVIDKAIYLCKTDKIVVMIKKTFSNSIDALEYETFCGVFTAHGYLIVLTDENILLFYDTKALKIKHKIQLNSIAPIKIVGNNLFVCFASYTECYQITEYGTLIKGDDMPPTKHIATLNNVFCLSGEKLSIYDKFGKLKKCISEKAYYVNSHEDTLMVSFWYNDICFLDKNLNILRKVDIEFMPFLRSITINNYIYATDGSGYLRKIAF